MQKIRNRVYVRHTVTRCINMTKKIVPLQYRYYLRQLNWKRLYFQSALFQRNQEKVYCPISEEELHAFPKGISIRTGARERHRLFWLYLKNETPIFTQKFRILHCAPQWGIRRQLLQMKHLDYVSGDKFLPGYDYEDGVQNIDLLNLCFSSESFDYVFCNRILEHIPDDKKAMEEMYRVLRKNGTAIISVPLDPTLTATHESFTSVHDRIRYYGQWDHVRMYGLDIMKRLEAVGFDVEKITYSDHYSQEEWKKYGLCKDTLFIARKRP